MTCSSLGQICRTGSDKGGIGNYKGGLPFLIQRRQACFVQRHHQGLRHFVLDCLGTTADRATPFYLCCSGSNVLYSCVKVEGP